MSLSGSVLSFCFSSLNTMTSSVLNSTQSVIMWIIFRSQFVSGFSSHSDVCTQQLAQTKNPLGCTLGQLTSGVLINLSVITSAEAFVN